MDPEVENDRRQDVQEPVSTRTKRMRLFLATYSLGALVALLAGEGYRIVPNPLVIIGAFFFLPTGVLYVVDFLTAMPMTERPLLDSLLFELQSLFGMLSYLLSFLIPLFGSSTTKPRTFQILYILFVALVIMNVAGCITASSNYR